MTTSGVLMGMLTSKEVPVNIRETDKAYEMDVVAPGLNKEDFNVNVSDKMLTDHLYGVDHHNISTSRKCRNEHKELDKILIALKRRPSIRAELSHAGTV